ncbi:MAG: putative 7-carboxy-7-deazaguanine synthase QueE [Ruminococcus sp.]|nr:putative 7-carboxy-7-deazaguanine synthase QueE [Ruminococcus sp.]
MPEVIERFVSINGEGAHAGELAAFIRFKGCNLSCSYCDTRYANAPDAPCVEETVQELAQWVHGTGVANVTLTGGEPLLQPEIGGLISILSSMGNRVEIETNGSIPLDTFAAAKHRPIFTMDYKLPSSGMESAMCTENFRLLGVHDTVKFVSGSMKDLSRAEEIMKKYDLIGRCHVYLSPVFGAIDPADIVGFMADRGLNGVRMQLQLHKFIWDPSERGV